MWELTGMFLAIESECQKTEGIRTNAIEDTVDPRACKPRVSKTWSKVSSTECLAQTVPNIRGLFGRPYNKDHYNGAPRPCKPPNRNPKCSSYLALGFLGKAWTFAFPCPRTEACSPAPFRRPKQSLSVTWHRTVHVCLCRKNGGPILRAPKRIIVYLGGCQNDGAFLDP